MAVRGEFYRSVAEVPAAEKLMPVSRPPEEIAELKEAEARGELPKGTMADLKERIDKQVFGADFKRDKNGKPIEVGIGTLLNPSINDYRATLAGEQAGFNPPGTAAAKAAAWWNADPEAAARAGIPRPDSRRK